MSRYRRLAEAGCPGLSAPSVRAPDETRESHWDRPEPSMSNMTIASPVTSANPHARGIFALTGLVDHLGRRRRRRVFRGLVVVRADDHDDLVVFVEVGQDFRGCWGASFFAWDHHTDARVAGSALALRATPIDDRFAVGSDQWLAVRTEDVFRRLGCMPDRLGCPCPRPSSGHSPPPLLADTIRAPLMWTHGATLHCRAPSWKPIEKPARKFPSLSRLIIKAQAQVYFSPQMPERRSDR